MISMKSLLVPPALSIVTSHSMDRLRPPSNADLNERRPGGVDFLILVVHVLVIVIVGRAHVVSLDSDPDSDPDPDSINRTPESSDRQHS